MPNIKTWTLEQIKEHIDLCMNCGACFARGPIVPHNWRVLPPHEWSSPERKCPIFEHYRFRAYSGYGIGVLAMTVFRDKYPITDDLASIAYSCTSCGMCTEICQIFQPLYGIWALREEIATKGFMPESMKRICDTIEEKGAIFGGRPIETPEAPIKGDTFYFSGCYGRYRTPEVSRAAMRVLKAAGIDASTLGENERCCGFIAKYSGNRGLFERQATNNIEEMKKAGAKRVIVSCAHCYRAWKVDYPRYAGELPFEVLHFSEVMAQSIAEKKLPLKEIGGKVTYHDPCFLGRHCGIYEQPRTVLSNIPGTTIVEMERFGKWSYCCGAGGKVTLNHAPACANAASQDRLREAMEAADTMVTGCTTCYDHMRRTALKHNIPVRVYDLPLFLEKALNVPV